MAEPLRLPSSSAAEGQDKPFWQTLSFRAIWAFLASVWAKLHKSVHRQKLQRLARAMLDDPVSKEK